MKSKFSAVSIWHSDMVIVKRNDQPFITAVSKEVAWEVIEAMQEMEAVKEMMGERK